MREDGRGYGEKIVDSNETTSDNEVGVPIEFQDENASDNYFANNSSYQDWAQSLTEDEKNAIMDYSQEGYMEINPWLRGQKTDINAFAKGDIVNLDSAIARFELDDDICVFRRFSDMDIGRMVPGYKGNLSSLIGLEIPDDAFMSATTVQGSFGPARNAQMTIVVPKGTGRGAFIKNHANYKTENEFLIARGRRIMVTDAYYENGKHKIIGEMIVDG